MTDIKRELPPSKPFLKENGKWSFYFYPEGIQKESIEYVDEQEAEAGAKSLLRDWESNGWKYRVGAEVN